MSIHLANEYFLLSQQDSFHVAAQKSERLSRFEEIFRSTSYVILRSAA
jgi:hypothetical protein